MKDGEIVQIGTAEDIVTSPADEYVADFVAGISRLKLVSAAKIMETLERVPIKHGAIEEQSTYPIAEPTTIWIVWLNYQHTLTSQSDKIWEAL